MGKSYLPPAQEPVCEAPPAVCEEPPEMSELMGNAFAQEQLAEKSKEGEGGGLSTGAIVGGLFGMVLGGPIGALAGGLIGDAIGSAIGGDTPAKTPADPNQAPDPKKVEALQAEIDAAKKLDADAAALEAEAVALAASGDAAGAQAKRDAAAAKKTEAVTKKNAAIQSSINTYNIDTTGAKSITYDPSVKGEAVTSKDGTIRIGDKAFKSAGWLGSSVGHESEVHWLRQAQKGNWYTGPVGTDLQEVETYQYEIDNAKRYGTTEADLKDLKARRQAHYDAMPEEYRKRADKGDYTMKPGEENN